MDKAEFRKKMLKRVENLGAERRREEDRAIFSRLFSLPEVRTAQKVFAYVGVGSEISTADIIDGLLALGKTVYVPLCHGGGEMDAVMIESRGELIPGRYNIPEPPKGNLKIPPEDLELIIVPGVAFARNGIRLGRGGGYYDRFLKKAHNAVKIALCREVNLEEKVPGEPHDERVDIIACEKEIIKVG